MKRIPKSGNRFSDKIRENKTERFLCFKLDRKCSDLL